MATKKQAAAAAPTETKVYKVISPLDHDGEHYDINDPVELTELQAAPLLGSVVTPVTG